MSPARSFRWMAEAGCRGGRMAPPRELFEEMLEKLFDASLTGKGARQLTSGVVEQIFAYAADKPFRLQITEAHMIESQADRAILATAFLAHSPGQTGALKPTNKRQSICSENSINRRRNRNAMPCDMMSDFQNRCILARWRAVCLVGKSAGAGRNFSLNLQPTIGKTFTLPA